MSRAERSPLDRALDVLKRTKSDPLDCWRRILANPSRYPAYSVNLAQEVMGKLERSAPEPEPEPEQQERSDGPPA